MSRTGARGAAVAGGLAVLPLLALLLAGCGNGSLWARWSAERLAWRARRAVARVELNPQVAGPADWERATAACRAVLDRFPAGRWSAAAQAGSAEAVGVLEASGRAAILLARLDDLRGDADAAAAGYDRARTAYRGAPAISLEAAVAQARVLERAGRVADEERVWAGIARDYPPWDPGSGQVFEAVLDAPLYVARARRIGGDAAGMDSALRAAERVYVALLETQRGRPAAPVLCTRLSEARWVRGDRAGALAALRLALADTAAGHLAPRLVLTLAQRALDGVSADTALVYAQWAARGFGPAVRPAALILAAQAWRAGGVPDSALETYERVVDEDADDHDAIVRARHERARLLEDLGRWDQARGEYHALASAAPTHRLALESMVRVVRHHMERGERELGMAEARHALEALDGLLASQQDDSVQMRVGEARARVLLESGDVRHGGGGLAALLRRYPAAPLDAALLMRAAEAAETQTHDTELALELSRAAAARAVDSELHRRAVAAVGRLSGASR